MSKIEILGLKASSEEELGLSADEFKDKWGYVNKVNKSTVGIVLGKAGEELTECVFIGVENLEANRMSIIPLSHDSFEALMYVIADLIKDKGVRGE